MKEKDFLKYNQEYQVTIKGGSLWKIPSYQQSGGIMKFDQQSKQLDLFLRPDSKFEEVQDGLYTITKQLNPVLYCFLWMRQRLPSLLLLIPITLTVLFIGFITVHGDLVINWFFLGENRMTVLGLPMHQAAIVSGIIAIICIYFFPVIFSGEQEGFIKALNERFSNREQLRKRLAATTRFLKLQKYVTSVEIWNPDLSNQELDWVERSLIPALFDARLEMVYHIRIDERHILENFIHEIVQKELVWEEKPLEYNDDDPLPAPIPYEYLENYEKSMLAVYVFASTASLSKEWLALQNNQDDGLLKNVTSLRLVKIIIDRFKERLFSEKDLQRLTSPELFASRCLNDYGILSPALRYNNDIWALHHHIVSFEIQKVKREMRFMTTFLQTEIDVLVELLDDPVAAIKLNSSLEKLSIYNKNRLTAIRFFVKLTNRSEQYKIFKQYWHLIIKDFEDHLDLNEEIYRIIGVEMLLQLTTIFERSAMYKHALNALNYVETIIPLKGKIGKARLKEREGKFEDAVSRMLEIRNEWKDDVLQLSLESIVDLNSDIAWVIVSGRLEAYRLIGREACDDARKALQGKFDSIRDSNRTVRLFNVLANYEEWVGNLEGALYNYNKALQIPGIDQTKLSNLFVNKGIALRKMKQFQASILYAEKGVKVKSAIGDADQLPIALHNLAQTCIELTSEISDEAYRQDLFAKTIEYAQKGLSIQHQTGSAKKRGQLLTEKFLGEFALSKRGKKVKTDPTNSLHEVQNWLQLQHKLGKGSSYDCIVVIKELLGSFEEFKGSTLEEVLSWKINPQTGTIVT